jgi:hypothetical protein
VYRSAFEAIQVPIFRGSVSEQEHRGNEPIGAPQSLNAAQSQQILW